MRIPVKDVEAYERFFASPEMNQLFDELVVEKLEMSQILMLLKDKPLTTAEIGETLKLEASDVSKYLRTATRRGLAAYDEGLKRYALVKAA